jgi:hypothetical protein
MTFRAFMDVYCGYCNRVCRTQPVEGVIDGDSKSFTWLALCPDCDLHIEGTDSIEKLELK